jgi:hypothetical protein
MKVLVTGSRNWINRDAIRRELKKLPSGTTIIHGACPTGADAIADSIALELGLQVRSYPADWDHEGKAAGPIRNARMVREEHKKGDPIDLVLAFTEDMLRSRGTKDCASRAQKAGIKVLIISG